MGSSSEHNDSKNATTTNTNGAADLLESAEAYTYDGDRSGAAHSSGLPAARELVLGGSDQRDAALEEHILSEDVAWHGRIFDVNRMEVSLSLIHI